MTDKFVKGMFLNYFSCWAISQVENLMFYTTHLAPNIMIGPTIASCVILNQFVFA